MSANRLPWFKCNPSKLLGAMAGLTADENLAYLTILLRIYDTGGPIPDDAKRLARRCGMTEKRVQAALESLCDAGKISVENGLIDSDTTHDTLEEMISLKKSAQLGGFAKAAKSKQKIEQIQGEFSADASTPQCGGNADGLPSKIESKDRDSHSSNEECVARAPAAAYADEIRKTYLRSSRAEPSLYLAGKWRQAGWPIEIVCDVIHAKLEATPGKNFPLQYFENAIAEAVERSKAPVPVTARTGGRSFAPSNSMPEPIVAKPMSVETQRNAMRTFVRTKNWPFLSPPPGEPGCPVSPEIIAEFQPAKESAA